MNILSKLVKLRGGFKPKEHKEFTNQYPIATAPLPSKVVIPLSAHVGAAATPVVEVGEAVKKGQCIAEAGSAISANLHASISGTVTAIEKRPVPHPSGLEANCIVIESDGKDDWTDKLPPLDPHTVNITSFQQRVADAGIVGMGGATFPTAVKLRNNNIDTIVINCAECEPYITCDDRLIQEHAHEIAQATTLLKRVMDATNVVFGIEQNKPEAIAALNQEIESNADSMQSISVKTVPTVYPSGGERQLLYILTGRFIPKNEFTYKYGVLMLNVATLLAIYRAIVHGEPLIERVVTLTGEGMQSPRNYKVRIGTLISELIPQTTKYNSQNIDALIIGGPMMGFTLPHDNVPVMKGTNCLLGLPQHKLPVLEKEQPCIRCGTCMEDCPVGLQPQMLYWFSRNEEYDKIERYHLTDCIECGVCASVCPSNIPLVSYFRHAKTDIHLATLEKQKSDIARERHDTRNERLERLSKEKEERMRKKREAMAMQDNRTGLSDDKQAAIRAAMERAKARKVTTKKTSDSPRKPPMTDAQKKAAIEAAKAKAIAKKANAKASTETGEK